MYFPFQALLLVLMGMVPLLGWEAKRSSVTSKVEFKKEGPPQVTRATSHERVSRTIVRQDDTDTKKPPRGVQLRHCGTFCWGQTGAAGGGEAVLGSGVAHLRVWGG